MIVFEELDSVLEEEMLKLVGRAICRCGCTAS